MFVSARHIFVAQDKRQTAECPDTDGDKRILKRQGLIGTQRHVFFPRTRPMPASERGSRRKRIWGLMRSYLGADATESGSRDERVWEQRRMRLGAEALTGIGNGGRSTVVRLAGRVRGGLCSVLRGTNIIAFFAKYLSSFTLRKVSYSASLFSAIWKIRQFVLTYMPKAFQMSK